MEDFQGICFGEINMGSSCYKLFIKFFNFLFIVIV